MAAYKKVGMSTSVSHHMTLLIFQELKILIVRVLQVEFLSP